MNRAASAGRLRPTTSSLVSGSHFTLTFGFAVMNALIESVSSASSVGDDDHPDMRISPESAALAPALALGVFAPGVLPHAAMRSARSATAARNDLRSFI